MTVSARRARDDTPHAETRKRGENRSLPFSLSAFVFASAREASLFIGPGCGRLPRRDGFISPTGSLIFTGTTRVGFLWSIATRAQ